MADQTLTLSLDSGGDVVIVPNEKRIGELFHQPARLRTACGRRPRLLGTGVW